MIEPSIGSSIGSSSRRGNDNCTKHFCALTIEDILAFSNHELSVKNDVEKTLLDKFVTRN